VSVFDKSGLDELVKGIVESIRPHDFIQPAAPGKKIVEILGAQAARNYVSVEDFTGAPEMEGGLVKTLHPKIHAGSSLKGETLPMKNIFTGTLAQKGGTPGVYFDVFVGNLYPFTSVISKEGTTSETSGG